MQICGLGQHIVSLDLVEDGLLLGENLEHDGHEEHEGEAASTPHDLECELLHDVEEHVALVDHFEEEERVVLNKLVLWVSLLFGLSPPRLLMWPLQQTSS